MAIPPVIPIDNSGDGVLIFCKAEPELAMRFARLFQQNAVERNERTTAVGGVPHGFRIGIATGRRVHAISVQSRPLAVRFHRRRMAIIDFESIEPIRPKEHENRTIEAYRWRAPTASPV